MFDQLLDRDLIPPSLDVMEPGPALAAFLSTIEVSRLSGHDRIVVLRAQQRMASHYSAKVYESMASVRDHLVELGEGAEFADDAAAAEIRAALRLTRRAADGELSFAMDLKRELPSVWLALVNGDLDVRRVKTIVSGVMHLPDDTARQVVASILEDAPRLTTGQLSARLRRLSIEADPEAAEDRYHHAVDRRRIAGEPSVDGTANLYAMDLPPDRVASATRRINHLARSLKAGGETRTMDQLRADVFLDLLVGRKQGGRGGTVDIQVDLETLARLGDAPGDLAGYGPVVADIARRVVESQRDSRWRFSVVDPDSGRPVHGGVIRRRPSSTQRREVETRNPEYVFPGCRMPSVECDLDHTVEWASGGQTTVDNLAPVCRHDHRIRHQAGWQREPLADGDHLWTSRLGFRYTTSGRSP